MVWRSAFANAKSTIFLTRVYTCVDPLPNQIRQAVLIFFAQPPNVAIPANISSSMVFCHTGTSCLTKYKEQEPEMRLGKIHSNQSFYRQIASHQRGVGDHRVYRPMMRGGYGPIRQLQDLIWGAFDHVSHAPQLRSCKITITYPTMSSYYVTANYCNLLDLQTSPSHTGVLQ